MASAREMSLRIRSVENIAQVTRALQAVSASRVRKAEARVRELEKKIAQLLAEREEIDQEMELTRSALRQVESNVNILCATRHRI